ncbi:MAG: chromate transporter [Clostridia bacterium]
MKTPKTNANIEKKSIKEQAKLLCQLFLIFFKIGAFTFGGGYAMISLIEKEISEKRKWVDDKEMLNILAIAESTPGVIALNSATYVGAKVGGFFGALVSSIAVMLPSIVIIIFLSRIITQFQTNQYVKWAFLGIRSAVVALILNAIFKLVKGVKKTFFSLIVFVIALTLAILSSFEIIPINIIWIIIAAALTGIIYGYFGRKNNKNTINIDEDKEINKTEEEDK